MACRRCNERVKDWNGDDPRCAFESGVFSDDNWRCATMDELRDLAAPTAVWSEDNNCAVLQAPEGSFVILGWYKRRGCTSFARVFDGYEFEPLTIEVAEMLIK